MPRQKKQQNTEVAVKAETTIKKTGRGGKYNFPSAVPPEDPEVVQRVLGETLHWLSTGVRQRCQTTEEIEDRTIEFFQHCAEIGERPSVEKYCLALGIPRNTVIDWKNGLHCEERRSGIIKSAYESIAAYDAAMVAEGKMNPVPYIFRAKNYYNMKDQTDLVVTPNNPLGDGGDATEVAEKYHQLPSE